MDCSTAILKTLAYADVFDYPLTQEQLYLYLITPRRIAKQTFLQSLRKLPREIAQKDSFYCLQKRENSIALRKEKEKASLKKWEIAHRVAKQLRVLPTVLCIGVSGGLAMQNASEDDDIDFFIITTAQTLWITRFCITLWLKLTGNLRTRGAARTKNKVCVNMFMSVEDLQLPKTMRDLYTAHEVVQMKPLIDKQKTHNFFLQANVWVQTFLPHAIPVQRDTDTKAQQYKSANSIIAVLEFFAKKFQLWYMQKRTNETITDTMLAFHRFDYRRHILYSYKKRVQHDAAL